MIRPLAAEVVDWGSLLEVIVVSLVGGVGVTAAFSLAVLGAVRSVDSARERRPVAAGVFGAVAIAALAGCLAAIVYGIAIMVSK
ncbi:MAG TPA: hypothetical protein VK387_09505 [Thermoleophilaceae bacterium]|nr:hypothetical protein [Thermoleophilaceae bacterium]